MTSVYVAMPINQVTIMLPTAETVTVKSDLQRYFENFKK